MKVRRRKVAPAPTEAKPRRRRKIASGKQVANAEVALSDFLSTPAQKRSAKSGRSAKPIFDVALNNATIRARTGDWEGADAKTLVGLYIVCHRMVYGLLPDDLLPDTEMRKAIRVARKCLTESFTDDASEMVDFIKWTWKRQRSKEDWALRQGRDLGRFMVWTQFKKSTVVDYRKALLDSARRNRGRK